jgi:lipopolysaccharide/colanic/teichoic acid biosynthesis glycosyltransferase
VNGRNTISWQTKFEYDVCYVENVSLFMDLKIIFLTIKNVVVREGVEPEGQVTMDYFEGNEKEF